MDYVQSFMGGRPLPRAAKIWNLTNLSPVVQEHLQQVGELPPAVSALK